MTRKYIIEATMPWKERLQKFALAKPEFGKKIALQIVGLLSDQLAEDFYVDYCLVNDLSPELDDDDNTKDRLIRFITKDVFLTEDVLPSLIQYVDDDVIETVVDYYGWRKMMESVMIEGKVGRALGAAALVASSLFGKAQAAEPVPVDVLPKNIQAEYSIDQDQLDAQAINDLSKKIKTQIVTQWEGFGYDNTEITNTKAWKNVLVILDTLDKNSPDLANLLRKNINVDLHKKMGITPTL